MSTYVKAIMDARPPHDVAFDSGEASVHRPVRISPEPSFERWWNLSAALSARIVQGRTFVAAGAFDVELVADNLIA